MNYKYEKLKMRECSEIIQNKTRATLSICSLNKPYSELIFYDTDCFCGCITLFFEVCKCGIVMDNIENNNNASILITNKCNNVIETVNLEGHLHIIEDNDCCCQNHKKDCYQSLEFKVDKVSGKRYYKC